jgi:hypothetical protein
MNKTIYIIIYFFSILNYCNLNSQTPNNGWNDITKYTKSIDNITYIFPSSVNNITRNDRINLCINAIKDNLAIINETSFKDSIIIEFLENRQQMLIYSGVGASGMAMPDRKALFALIDSPPIKHELMHMITIFKWGYPHETSKWMNEGLATYANGKCNGYSIEQIYAYLYENIKLIPIDKLTGNFYNNPEMIAYHQSGFLAEFLLKNYGLEKFKALWKRGIVNFEEIYSFRFSDLTKTIEENIKKNIRLHQILIGLNLKKDVIKN